MLVLVLIAATFAAVDPQVWIFARTDCPISNRYAPAMEALYRKYSGEHIQFLLVYSEPGATKLSIEKHRAEYRLTIPYEIDSKHERVRRAGIRATPEAAVFGRNGALVYRGRIDDREAILGTTRRSNVRKNDLDEVLNLVATGKPPNFRTTRAIGCAIERPEQMVH